MTSKTRRELMKGVGAAAASLALSTFANSQETSGLEKILDERVKAERALLSPRARSRFDRLSQTMSSDSKVKASSFQQKASNGNKLEYTLGGQPDLWFGGVQFNWFKIAGNEKTIGQFYGPYVPLDGRDSWDGSVEMYERHILLQMMAGLNFRFSVVANGFEQEEMNGFIAEKNLQNKNYRLKARKNMEKYYFKIENVDFLQRDPREAQDLRVSPYFAAETFDCYDCPKDFSREADLNRLYAYVQNWFTRFLSVRDSKDLTTMDGKVLAGIWYVPGASSAKSGFFKTINERLKQDFGFECYWTAHEAWEKADPDEINHLFSGMEPISFNTRFSADLLTGWWPPTVEQAKNFLLKKGGATYAEALQQYQQILSSVSRLCIIESISEYTEASKILPIKATSHYIGDPHLTGPTDLASCFNKPCHPVPLDDRWSDRHEPEAPFEYLILTREAADKMASRLKIK